jgi:hypothetical protein
VFQYKRALPFPKTRNLIFQVPPCRHFVWRIYLRLKSQTTRMSAFLIFLYAACVVGFAEGWHECTSQSLYGGLYGYNAVANLTEFRSGLLR